MSEINYIGICVKNDKTIKIFDGETLEDVKTEINEYYNNNGFSRDSDDIRIYDVTGNEVFSFDEQALIVNVKSS